VTARRDAAKACPPPVLWPVACALLAWLLLAGAASPAPVPLDRRATAFVGVSVVPMNHDTVLAEQTVVVRDGRIVAVGPSDRATIPAGATRVDGRGKYLIPGLHDMHVHLRYLDQAADNPRSSTCSDCPSISPSATASPAATSSRRSSTPAAST
jgi:imidazolonepropionase-like amidohydrolase